MLMPVPFQLDAPFRLFFGFVQLAAGRFLEFSKGPFAPELKL